MIKEGLGFIYIRSKLFNKKYDDSVKKVFNTTYQELLDRRDKERYNTNIIDFMLAMMNSASKELDNDNLLFAAHDINILHNLPETIYNKWDKCYFFEFEILGYCDIMFKLNRPDKVKKLINNISKHLDYVDSSTQAMK